jgi:beta-N-acetylhexosaminidase
MTVKGTCLYVIIPILLALICFLLLFLPTKVVELDEAFGQNLVVGISDINLSDKTKEILNHIKPSGIVLYRRNYEDDDQFKKLIEELQESVVIKYFIMLDEEPDGAERIGRLKNVFSLGLPDWKEIEADIQEIASLGINVELAPVSDFPFDDNSFMKRRVPADTVDDLKAFNKTFIELLNENNMIATLKHFPGLGVFVEDPHTGLPNLYVEEKVFNESLNIFNSGIDNGAKMVMTGHAIYKNIDSNNLSTTSSEIIDLLDNFDGLIVTDDLMDMLLTVDDINLEDTGLKALEAGHNLIMFSHRLEDVQVLFDKMIEEIKNDKKLEKIVRKNYWKIIKFKKENLINKFNNF